MAFARKSKKPLNVIKKKESPAAKITPTLSSSSFDLDNTNQPLGVIPTDRDYLYIDIGGGSTATSGRFDTFRFCRMYWNITATLVYTTEQQVKRQQRSNPNQMLKYDVEVVELEFTYPIALGLNDHNNLYMEAINNAISNYLEKGYKYVDAWVYVRPMTREQAAPKIKGHSLMDVINFRNNLDRGFEFNYQIDPLIPENYQLFKQAGL